MTGTLATRVLADLVVDLLVAGVGFDDQPRIAQLLGRDLLDIGVGLRRDRCDDDLHRREPERHMAGEVLDQDAEEALHRAADGAVDHDRLLLFGVLVDIEGAEALRQVEVDLRGAALPFPADGVLKRVFEFRSVEGPLARQDAGLDAAARLRLDLSSGHRP
jgi:hypothetical protein